MKTNLLLCFCYLLSVWAMTAPAQAQPGKLSEVNAITILETTAVLLSRIDALYESNAITREQVWELKGPLAHQLQAISLENVEIPLLLSDDELIDKAHEAIASRVRIPERDSQTRPIVSHQGGLKIVTFPTKLPPGVRGGDFNAEVRMHPVSGGIFNIRVGS